MSRTPKKGPANGKARPKPESAPTQENGPESAKKPLFVKGGRGGPGRPKGLDKQFERDLRASVAQMLPDLMEVLRTKIAEGNLKAVDIALSYTAAPRKDTPIPTLDMAGVDLATQNGVIEAGRRIGNALFAGEITPSESDYLMRWVELQRRALTEESFLEVVDDLTSRMDQFESMLRGQGPVIEHPGTRNSPVPVKTSVRPS